MTTFAEPRAGAWHSVLARVAVVVTFALAAGLPATRLPFGGDDQYILARAASPSLAERLSVYTAEAPGPLSQRIGAWWMGLEYRRVFVRIAPSAVVSIERALFGTSPHPYHLVSLLLHAASAVLLYLLARRLAASGALVAASLFAAHPAVSEMVSWLAVTGTLVGTLFALAALLAATGSGRRWPLAACVIATALAMTSYEAFVALPLLIVAFGRAGVLPSVRRRSVEVALLALLPLYGILRRALGTIDLSVGSAFPKDEVVPLILGDTAGYALRALGASKAQASWFHGVAPIAASLPVVVVIVATCIWLARHHRAAALGFAAAVCFLAPPILVRATVGVLNTPSYRQLYPALVGLAIMVAAAIPPIRSQIGRVAAHAAALVPLALGWVHGATSTLWGHNVERLSEATRAATRDAPPNALVVWVGAQLFFPYSVTYDWPERSELYLLPPAPPRAAPPRLCANADGTLVAEAGGDPLANALFPAGDRVIGRLRRAQRPLPVATGTQDLSAYVPGRKASVRRLSPSSLGFSFDIPASELVVLEVASPSLTVRRLTLGPCGS
jgi:hypothetical protein